jgi:hypothetical protein
MWKRGESMMQAWRSKARSRLRGEWPALPGADTSAATAQPQAAAAVRALALCELGGAKPEQPDELDRAVEGVCDDRAGAKRDRGLGLAADERDQDRRRRPAGRVALGKPHERGVVPIGRLAYQDRAVHGRMLAPGRIDVTL